ncbi:MAG: division/cell wall cluster transcriptional repressor MraZ [Synergistaceae bacterium]|nr:division/cell wall cluster transcriptional repressor MraZ [Synergistaceae bacterium]
MSNGLFGHYVHKLDSKGRIVLPARFREELGQFVMATISTEKCISVFPMPQWELLRDNLSEKKTGSARERRLYQMIMTSAHELEIDVAGRILLPQFLRDFVGIKQEVSVNGIDNRLQIWDLATWQEVWEIGLKELQETAEEKGWPL